MHQYSLLSLGDSYTIGEAVPLHQNFPYQAVQLLRKKGYDFHAPEIIAKTGWTSDELEDALREYSLLSKYDFVTLLIGVNNQYRGLEVIPFKDHFEELVKKAIEKANGKKEHVVVLTIPDYSITPYAQSLDIEKTAKDLEVFNSVIRAISIQYKVQFIDITPGTREAREDTSLLAADGLHPSVKEYTRWAEKVAAVISSQLK